MNMLEHIQQQFDRYTKNEQKIAQFIIKSPQKNLHFPTKSPRKNLHNEINSIEIGNYNILRKRWYKCR